MIGDVWVEKDAAGKTFVCIEFRGKNGKGKVRKKEVKSKVEPSAFKVFKKGSK